MNSDEHQASQVDLPEPLGMQEASAQELIQAEEQSLPEEAQPSTLIEDPWGTEESLPEKADVSVLPLASSEPAGENTEKNTGSSTERERADLEKQVATLQQQVQTLKQEIVTLETSRSQLQGQIIDAQSSLGRLVQDGLSELEQRKKALQISVEQLERRQERIRNEMRTTFAGVSQDIAIRVKSFKDYLVGSLQDLAFAAEQLDLPTVITDPVKQPAASEVVAQPPSTPKFAEQTFQDQTKRIRNLLDQYRNRPDYYGPPWQLRRTFEPVHADRVSEWFFTQGGRGAVRTMGSRLQNILIASAAISITRSLYDERLRVLVLAQSPERLGEWRRGLQDCLGVTRSDFGPDRGIALFEDPEPLAQRADRMVKDGLLPVIVIDETEEEVSLSLLQFPLWLAFAPNPQAAQNTYLY